jgi:hypothetical protein
MGSVPAVLAAMRDSGTVLHLHYCRHYGPTYTLGDGRVVVPETAVTVIKDPHIVDVGDALFHGPGQTYRYSEN